MLSAIPHINPLTGASLPAEFLYALTKNLFTHLVHCLRVVLLLYSTVPHPNFQ